MKEKGKTKVKLRMVADRNAKEPTESLDKLRLEEAMYFYCYRNHCAPNWQALATYVYRDCHPTTARNNLYKIRKGTTTLYTIKTLRRICEYLQVDMNFLFGMERKIKE